MKKLLKEREEGEGKEAVKFIADTPSGQFVFYLI